MPKLTRAPESQKALADELRKLYGVCLTLVQVGDAIGAKSKDTTKKWLDDMPYATINGRKKWLVYDVAKKINDSRVVP